VDPDGSQVVNVTIDGGYHPASIVARSGLPLRLIFRRAEHDDACSERVVFSTPKLDRRLDPIGTTTVELPAQPPGEVRFTCGMGRYRGRIELVADGAPSITDGIRDWAASVEASVGTLVILALCALPLVALAAVALLDGTAAVLAAGTALVAWVAGCAWAFTRPVRPT